jgi:hypothetical protein
MAKIVIHAGDYARGAAWFYAAHYGEGTGFGFVVRKHNNRPHRIPLEAVAAAEPASVEWIRRLGGSERMVATLERLPDRERASTFVVLFADGTMMLATTDMETCWRICAG